ncbi:hypothetical protein ACN2AK_05455 [Shewanella xiamenensis]
MEYYNGFENNYRKARLFFKGRSFTDVELYVAFCDITKINNCELWLDTINKNSKLIKKTSIKKLLGSFYLCNVVSIK